MNHLLHRKEKVKFDLEEAWSLFSTSELTEGTAGELNFASSEAYNTISDIVGVPTYTRKKLRGKQMIVNWSEAVTENQRLDVEVRFNPFIMLRPDRNVELNVILDSIWFKFEDKDVKSQATTDNFSDHFFQSLKVVVRPTGKWSEFPLVPGFGLTEWSPGNELNPLMVQKGRSHDFTAGVNLEVNPTAGLQLNGNRTSGTTFPAFGFEKSAREGHAYVFVHKLHRFKDGRSAKNLRCKRFYKFPKIPKAVRGEVNYPNLGKNGSFAGTWVVPYATAMELRNELEFTICLEAKLPAVWKCPRACVMHLFKAPEHKLRVLNRETRRICVFAVARLTRFIGEST